MATPGEKLAESLVVLKDLQDQGKTGIKSQELNRVHRERLLKGGFISEVMLGWYIVTSHEEDKGDSTSWYTSFWGFCSDYLKDRYKNNYRISSEQAILLHTGNNTVPKQLIIESKTGNNRATNLLYGTSLFIKNSTNNDESKTEIINNLIAPKLAYALTNCSARMFISNPIEMRSALMMIRDASELLEPLLNGGHSVIAGRLIGAYRNLGQDKIANNISKTMTAAGYKIREEDPFEYKSPIAFKSRDRSPYVNRVRLMWHEMRKTVINIFPTAPGEIKDKDAYLNQIDELYTTDAYHSLSIEKYKVSAELIDRVRSGNWDPKENEKDREHRSAMAARGYWQAFNKVKESISSIINGDNPGTVLDEDHGDWYLELFAPSIATGIVTAGDLAGYRNEQVYIGQSMHTPPNNEAVRDIMPLLFELLEEEENGGVRAVLGHFIFVYTHPYMDGNGRMGRFIMNAMLASGGYPWTVIPVEERDNYMNSLEAASVDGDIKPFAEFIAMLVKAGLEGKPLAKLA